MLFNRLALISIIVLLFASCTSGIENPSKKGLIPKKEFSRILAEIQITDGLVTLPTITGNMHKVDSSTTYHYIVEKYGYTKEELDKTLRYYFLKEPKKLITIYEETLAKLTEMESLLDKQIKQETDKKANIWPGERNFIYPSSAEERPDFEVRILGYTPYVLKFTATLFPDDQSINVKAKMFAVNPDSISSGTKVFFESPEYIKDGMPHTYQMRILVNQRGWPLLKGSLYDIANNPGSRRPHIIFENIELRTPPPDDV